MRLRNTLVLAVLLIVSTVAAAASPQAGKDYRVLQSSQPSGGADPVEVREFFSYACPHCFDFSPKVHDWEEQAGEDVKLVKVPVTFNRESWALLAKAYYVGEVLGVLDSTHTALFEAIHVQGRRFDDAEALADFFASQGVDRQKALDAFDSFAVDAKMRGAERLVKDYRISSTPSMAVAGQYVVDVRSAGGQDGMLNVVDYLVQRQLGG